MVWDDGVPYAWTIDSKDDFIISKKGQIIMGVVIFILLIAVMILFYCSTSKGIKVDFGNVGSYDGKWVTIEGFLGENVSLQQFLQGSLPIDSDHQYYSFSSGKSPDEKIILMFDDFNYPYIDQGAFIRVTGQVYVISSEIVYLHVTTINLR